MQCTWGLSAAVRTHTQHKFWWSTHQTLCRALYLAKPCSLLPFITGLIMLLQSRGERKRKTSWEEKIHVINVDLDLTPTVGSSFGSIALDWTIDFLHCFHQVRARSMVHLFACVQVYPRVLMCVCSCACVSQQFEIQVTGDRRWVSELWQKGPCGWKRFFWENKATLYIAATTKFFFHVLCSEFPPRCALFAVASITYKFERQMKSHLLANYHCWVAN